ncbi:unnamed protein product [Caenorhabditis brenneri]
MNRRRTRSENNDDLASVYHDIQPNTFIEQECTTVWRFPLDISQSSIGGRTTLSNACTLIALKTAELIHIHNIEMPKLHPKSPKNLRVTGGAEMVEGKLNSIKNLEVYNNENSRSELEPMKCPTRIISCLVNGIIDGNEAYIKDAGEGSTRNYNLPDAIQACDLSFSEVDFKLTTGSIKETLPRLIRLATRHPHFRAEKRLAFILISCVRTVLIIFDRGQHSLTLFDGHHHLCPDKSKPQKHGALIGTCRYSNLTSFSQWIQHSVFPDITTNDEAFEISLIQMTNVGASKARGSCRYSERLTPLRASIFQPQELQKHEESRLYNQKAMKRRNCEKLRFQIKKRPTIQFSAASYRNLYKSL